MDEAVEKIRLRRLNRKQEAYAKSMANGASWQEATLEAGYSKDSGEAASRARHPGIVARVAELILEQKWGGSEDLAPVIDAMRRLYDESNTLKSAAAIKERREILVQVARLKALLPYQQPRSAPRPQMTREEWKKTFVPKDL